jgi:hypothetical protein
MKKNLFILAIAFTSMSFFSCKKTEIPPPEKIEIAPALVIGPGGTCAATEVTLMAGQTMNAGTVSVTNDANYYYVTYTTANGWVLTQTHLYVGSCATIPVNNPGNPIPGQFPYNSTHSYTTTYTYQVPISVIGAGNCGCIAAHAVVVKLNSSGGVASQQTGWGNGTPINPGSGNWGMKFEYCTCTESTEGQ